MKEGREVVIEEWKRETKRGRKGKDKKGEKERGYRKMVEERNWER